MCVRLSPDPDRFRATETAEPGGGGHRGPGLGLAPVRTQEGAMRSRSSRETIRSLVARIRTLRRRDRAGLDRTGLRRRRVAGARRRSVARGRDRGAGAAAGARGGVPAPAPDSGWRRDRGRDSGGLSERHSGVPGRRARPRDDDAGRRLVRDLRERRLDRGRPHAFSRRARQQRLVRSGFRRWYGRRRHQGGPRGPGARAHGREQAGPRSRSAWARRAERG